MHNYQDPDHQNLLCSHGIITVLSQCVSSSMPKVSLNVLCCQCSPHHGFCISLLLLPSTVGVQVIQAALQCLSSVVYENKTAANMVVESTTYL